MVRVTLESPYAEFLGASVERHVEYAQRCLADCLQRGEAPFASHLLYTQPHVLDDKIPEQRKLGIEAGLEWQKLSDKVVVYIDMGISPGMQAAIDHANANNIPVEMRTL